MINAFRQLNEAKQKAPAKRRYSGFKLDLITVVKENITFDYVVGVSERRRLMPVDEFRLENREEVFSHGIVKAEITS